MTKPPEALRRSQRRRDERARRQTYNYAGIVRGTPTRPLTMPIVSRSRDESAARYRFKKKPYPHQVRALKDLLARGWGGALLMEPRTGKTKVVVDYSSILFMRGRIRHVLVICPIAALSVWETEIAESCPFPYTLEIWDREGRGSNPYPEQSDGLHFILINDDAFSVSDTRSKGAGRLRLRNILRSWGIDLCVLDESHRIKSPSAKRSRAIHTFQEFCKYRVIMTGTPVTKKKRVMDIYSQWKFLNPARFADVVDGKGHANFQAFKEKFQVWLPAAGKRGFPIWLRNRNKNTLRARIHADAFEVALRDCRDMPPSATQVIPIALDSSARAYDEMYREMIAELEDGDRLVADIKLVQILKLAQITSGIAKTDQGEWVRVGEEKLRTMRSLLENWFEEEQKIVVVARWREDIRAVAELGEKLKVPTFRYQGGMKRKEKDESVRGFREAHGAALFVGQPKAMGLAIDLSVSHTMVWYSLTTSFVDWSQCCDRINLSPLPRSYVYLLAQGTVDEGVYETLLEDKDVVEYFRSSPERLARRR